MIDNCYPCVTFAFYYQVTSNYTAISSITTIVLSLRIGDFYFALDGVSVRDFLAPTTELISNGGFETGDLTNWTYCNQLNASITGGVKTNFTYRGYTYYPEAGLYYYLGGNNISADYISQSFPTQMGHTYGLTLYLMYPGNSSSTSANLFFVL
jgi:hypothetical protein